MTGDDVTLADRRGFDTEVYEPAEDSRLLASAALGGVGRTDLVLDVGTGSGYVGARIHEERGARVVGSDVNPIACRRARERGIEAVCADLVAPFRADAFDVVTFNPPYLPADAGAGWDDWFEVAITGGETGREVIEAFLDGVGRVLAPDGAVYLLVSSVTGVEEVVEHAGVRGFSAVAVEDDPYPGETLSVLKLFR